MLRTSTNVNPIQAIHPSCLLYRLVGREMKVLVHFFPAFLISLQLNTVLYLHRLAIRHKDIEPCHILVDHDVVLLTYFEISKVCADTRPTTDGPIVRTSSMCSQKTMDHASKSSLSETWVTRMSLSGNGYCCNKCYKWSFCWHTCQIEVLKNWNTMQTRRWSENGLNIFIVKIQKNQTIHRTDETEEWYRSIPDFDLIHL